MPNARLPAHIIVLDDSEDALEKDFDADLAALRIAASRAQDAAIRYEARTTSLKKSFSAFIPETRDVSPPRDTRGSRRHHRPEQERNQEHKRSSCQEDGKKADPRIESPELVTPDGHYDDNRAVQPKDQGSGDISSTRTEHPTPSSVTSGDRLSVVNVIALEYPDQTETAISKPRLQPISSAGSTANAQKPRNRTSSPDVWITKTSSKKARKVEEIAPATRTAHLGKQSPQSHAEESHTQDENHFLTTVFRSDIYPLIKTACLQHPGIRSKEQAHSVGRAVRDNAVLSIPRPEANTCATES